MLQTSQLKTLGALLIGNCFYPGHFQQLQDHLVKKEHNKVPENSGSEIASLLEELDDLIVDPYERKDEDEQKLRLFVNKHSFFLSNMSLQLLTHHYFQCKASTMDGPMWTMITVTVLHKLA